jgi:hypothetical protein
MVLTGKEILELAAFAGFNVIKPEEEFEEEFLESKYLVFTSPDGRKFARNEECSDEGCHELSNG